MKLIKATKEDVDEVFKLVQDVINSIYPKYYPLEVVEFFLKHHSKKRVLEDIENERTYILSVDGKIVGTGTVANESITRVFVALEFQGQGLGNCIMQRLEYEILENYDEVLLDSSLSASHFYEKRGYVTIRHEIIAVRNDKKLVYDVMRKQK